VYGTNHTVAQLVPVPSSHALAGMLLALLLQPYSKRRNKGLLEQQDPFLACPAHTHLQNIHHVLKQSICRHNRYSEKSESVVQKEELLFTVLVLQPARNLAFALPAGGPGLKTESHFSQPKVFMVQFF